MTKHKIIISRQPANDIEEHQMSKVYVTNHIIEVITAERKSHNLSNYRKLNGNGCVNMETGEWIEYQSNPRSENHKSMTRTFTELRRLINQNFIGSAAEKHLVLTYQSDMRDYHQANIDFKRFWSRFRYQYPYCEYIRIIEPQRTGRWHTHVLLKRNDNRPLHLDYEKVCSIWRLGRIHISNLPFSDNFGAYFSASFTDVDVFEDLENQSIQNQRQVLKGERLRFYPPHFKLYACSKGIVRPIPTAMPYENVRHMVQGCERIYSYTNHIIEQLPDGTEQEVNAITYEQFNLQRKNKQENESK